MAAPQLPPARQPPRLAVFKPHVHPLRRVRAHLPTLHLQIDGPTPWCVVGSAYDDERGGTEVTAVYGPVAGPEEASELLNHLEALGLGVSQKLEVIQTFPVTGRGVGR